MIGHLAMSNTVTALEPSPSTFADLVRQPPVRTTASALTVSSSTVTSVTPTRIGIVFQIGRPSSTSQTTLEARMNAAM